MREIRREIKIKLEDKVRNRHYFSCSRAGAWEREKTVRPREIVSVPILPPKFGKIYFFNKNILIFYKICVCVFNHEMSSLREENRFMFKPRGKYPKHRFRTDTSSVLNNFGLLFCSLFNTNVRRLENDRTS